MSDYWETAGGEVNAWGCMHAWAAWHMAHCTWMSDYWETARGEVHAWAAWQLHVWPMEVAPWHGVAWRGGIMEGWHHGGVASWSMHAWR